MVDIYTIFSEKKMVHYVFQVRYLYLPRDPITLSDDDWGE